MATVRRKKKEENSESKTTGITKKTMKREIRSKLKKNGKEKEGEK